MKPSTKIVPVKAKHTSKRRSALSSKIMYTSFTQDELSAFGQSTSQQSDDFVLVFPSDYYERQERTSSPRRCFLRPRPSTRAVTPIIRHLGMPSPRVEASALSSCPLATPSPRQLIATTPRSTSTLDYTKETDLTFEKLDIDSFASPGQDAIAYHETSLRTPDSKVFLPIF
mmetsp:Transcript_6196/g.15824  ORF Transcript_6196/g.15824 Transcript_6196/m.15824 type:complete len:171 (+) Transcript_6196:133-645(+)